MKEKKKKELVKKERKGTKTEKERRIGGLIAACLVVR